MKHTISKKLRFIYKASNCTDVNDCDIALNSIKDLVVIYGWKPSFSKRFNSISKIKDKMLKNKK